jgi:hypothetical protein
MALFMDFHAGNLLLHSINFRTIILLPKCREATHIKEYRPICLLNISFKKLPKWQLVGSLKWHRMLLAHPKWLSYRVGT